MPWIKNMKSHFMVEGMHCGSCANRVETAIRQLPGIDSAKADVNAARAEVSYDSAKVDAAQIQKQITEAGYKAKTL